MVNEEVINHYGAIRLRVVGSGSLKPKLMSLDDVKQKVLLPLTLKTKNNIEPTRITNFTQQRSRLELRTTEINESFGVSKIVIFVRPTAKSYPSGKN